MASFFLLFDVMSCEALRQKGAWKFWKSKVLKLGFPTMVYSFVGPLIISFILRVLKGEGWSVAMDGRFGLSI